MATKRTETAKAAKATKAVKVEPVKVEAVAEVAAVEPVKAEEVKAEAPKKAPAKKTTVKKASEEKTCNFYIQYAGKQFSYEEIIDKCKEAAAAEMGKKVSSVKTVDIYCKPEEHAAYYVANGKVAGRIDL